MLGANPPASLVNISAEYGDSFFFPSFYGANQAPLIDVAQLGDNGFACGALRVLGPPPQKCAVGDLGARTLADWVPLLRGRHHNEEIAIMMKIAWSLVPCAFARSSGRYVSVSSVVPPV